MQTGLKPTDDTWPQNMEVESVYSPKSARACRMVPHPPSTDLSNNPGCECTPPTLCIYCCLWVQCLSLGRCLPEQSSRVGSRKVPLPPINGWPARRERPTAHIALPLLCFSTNINILFIQQDPCSRMQAAGRLIIFVDKGTAVFMGNDGFMCKSQVPSMLQLSSK